MAVEHQPSAPEHEKVHEELEATAAERREELLQNAERSAETDNADKRMEQAREVINQHEQAPEPTPAPEAAPKPAPTIPLLNIKLNYAETLASLQTKLSPVSRRFSKVIHAPVVEKTSEVLEHTIARPSITAGALWTALIVGSIFYFTARHYGYNLAGSEITLSFFVGGAIGLGLEALWRSFRRSQRH